MTCESKRNKPARFCALAAVLKEGREVEIYLDETYNALINNSETNVAPPRDSRQTTKETTLILCRSCVSPASRRSGMFSREFRPGKKVMPVVIATVGQISPLRSMESIRVGRCREKRAARATIHKSWSHQYTNFVARS